MSSGSLRRRSSLVASVTAVTLFTDRVRQAMVLRANTLLAADLTLDSSFPIAEPYLEEARRLGFETARRYRFAACWWTSPRFVSLSMVAPWKIEPFSAGSSTCETVRSRNLKRAERKASRNGCRFSIDATGGSGNGIVVVLVPGSGRRATGRGYPSGDRGGP